MTTQNKTNQYKQDFVYAGKTQTAIWLETQSQDNPYISQSNYLFGYPHTDLIKKKSFPETLFLLFTGELPTPEQAQLLERLMVALINLGPRHPAVKASMVAGVSKTNTEHLLPIGLSVLGGEENGAKEVFNAITFLQANIGKKPTEVAKQLITDNTPLNTQQGQTRLIAGFGTTAGDIDITSQQLATSIFSNLDLATLPIISWTITFVEQLKAANIGWLPTGIAACVLYQLGIAPREAIGLYQLLCAPGIFAHGVEQTHKPITAMPMLCDEQHIYSQD